MFRRTWPVIGLLLLAGCESPRDVASRETSVAAMLLESGDLSAARAAVQRAIRARDDVAAAYIIQGRIDQASGRTADAFQAFTKAQELDAVNVEALLQIAELGLVLGKVREAGLAADQLLLIEPTLPRALLVKGLIAIDARRIDDATGFADQLLAAAPDDQGGLILRARTLAVGGDPAKALAVVDDAIARLGASDALTATRMEINRTLGDVPAFLGAAENLIDRSPTNMDLRLDLANALYKSGNIERARASVAMIVRTRPEDRPLMARVSGLWQEYDDRPLNAELREAIADSRAGFVRLMLARRYLRQEDVVTTEWLLAPEVRKNDFEALGIQARAAALSRQHGRALDIVKTVLTDDAENPDALLARAAIFNANGRGAAAMIDLQRVIRDNPWLEEAHIMIAESYTAQGQNGLARQALLDASAAIPQALFLHTQIVKYFLRRQDAATAESVARNFALANPASVRAWALYRDVCRKLQRDACSRAAAGGEAKARTMLFIDQRPGTPRPRGLFGRL